MRPGASSESTFSVFSHSGQHDKVRAKPASGRVVDAKARVGGRPLVEEQVEPRGLPEATVADAQGGSPAQEAAGQGGSPAPTALLALSCRASWALHAQVAPWLTDALSLRP